MEDFYEFFFKLCAEYFTICKTVEKELFLKDIQEPYTNISDININHYEDTSIFISHAEEEIEKYKKSQRFNEKEFYNNFCKHISKTQVDKIRSLSCKLYKYKLQDNECRQIIYASNFMKKNASRRSRRQGLLLPRYNNIKIQQEYYDRKEMFYILSSFKSMGTNKKFFNKYIFYLVRRYLSIMDPERRKIKYMITKMKKIVDSEKENMNSEESQSQYKEFKKNLDDKNYSDAHKNYSFIKSYFINNKNIERMNNYFIKLNIKNSISEITKDKEGNEVSRFDDKTREDYEQNKNITPIEKIVIDEHNKLIKEMIGDKRLENILRRNISVADKVVGKKKDLNLDKVKEIKRNLIRELLTNNITQKETIKEIKENLCEKYSDSRGELLYLYIAEYSPEEQRMNNAKHSSLEQFVKYLGSFYTKIKKDNLIEDKIYKEKILDIINVQKIVINSLKPTRKKNRKKG